MNEKNNDGHVFVNPATQEPVKAVYFIGIGGIGMSAIARYFHAKGITVSGYDKTRTALTTELEDAGITVHYEEAVDLAPKDVQLVVYTPAIPKDHKELVYYQQQGYTVVKRSDVLQIITESSFNICIAGTHGKTTITTMVAHLLRDSGFGCNAFLGGVSVNYGTNFWSSERNVCVIEADEYDRSFLKLSPDVAVITAMDADHLDIYGTAAAVEQAFIDFSKKLKPGGLLVSKTGLSRAAELMADKHLTYSLQDENADVFACNIRIENGGYVFDVMMKEAMLENVLLNMGGLHNVENAVAAIVVAHHLGIEEEKIRKAVGNFRGVKRRFEFIIRRDRFAFIDDYAHHPEELKALLTGVKALFNSSTCTIIFQPHLYSRTRDLADEFAAVLDMADEVILLPVYPAREIPIADVSSELIAEKMKNKNCRVMEKEDLLEWIRNDYRSRLQEHKDCVLVTAGAGDVDRLIHPVKKILIADDLT